MNKYTIIASFMQKVEELGWNKCKKIYSFMLILSHNSEKSSNFAPISNNIIKK